MHLQMIRDRDSAGTVAGRVGALLITLFATIATVLGPAVGSASAAKPEKTDVMFIFDTSGSMSGVLTETQEEIKNLVANINGTLPNVEFGVANVEDLPGYNSGGSTPTLSETEFEENNEKPWKLWKPLTTNQAEVEKAIEELSNEEKLAHSGGDLPEAYGRALWETATNPKVGWRAGARHEIVLIADNVPHAPNVNEGIPTEFQFTEPFNDGVGTWPNTGEELGGKFGIAETQWKPGESLEFHKTLARLNAEEKPLAMVDYHHTGQPESSNYIHYWEYWAAATGGQAISSEEGSKSLDAKLAQIVKESAEGIPPCPPGYTRTPTTPCVKKPPEEVHTPPTNPPTEKHPPVVLEETGEIELEYEAPEPGEFEFEGEIVEGAELSRVHSLSALSFGNSLLLSQLEEQNAAPVQNEIAFAAKHKRHKHKPKKCRKGEVRKHGRCVSNAPVRYGHGKLPAPTAGRYKIRIKPSGRVLAALKQGKTLNVRVIVIFTPAGTAVHIRETASVKVHLKVKHPKKKHHHGKHHGK